MTENRIVIGDPAAPLYAFDNSAIRTIRELRSVDIIGAELAIDQMTPEVGYDKDAAELWTPSDYDGILSSDGYLWATSKVFDDIRTLPYGTVIRYYHGGALAGKFYTRNVDRIAKELYRINAISAVGLLDQQRHTGGVYHGQTFKNVAAEIIGDAVPFSCDDDVARQTVFGWLPLASKRENLHQLLFATGAALTKDENGDIRFTFLSGDAPVSVTEQRIFIGGNVDYSSPASTVEITEHSFYALDSAEAVTLFDNTDGSGAADGTLVSFQNAPVHDLTASENLEIVESGVNYAIVTGIGTLTGKPYTHTTRVITRSGNPSGEENVVTVTDATLVSVANSDNVADRVFAYYSSKKTVGASIVLDGEQAGDQLAFPDPYGEESSGFLSSMEINVSSKLKAECTIITDYVPTAQGNSYQNYQILQFFGTWRPPAGVTRIKATLIGGGSGGWSGGRGKSGNAGTSSSNGTGGEGGVGGEGGSGGKIFTVTIPVKPGVGIPYSCGEGGQSSFDIGENPVAGFEGEATTFGDYTSADGVASPNGVINVFTGDVYAIKGTSGMPGGKGSQGGGERGDTITVGDQSWGPGADSESGSDSNGSWGAGGGGGAAVGLNGYDATPGYSEPYVVNGGHGGNGAPGYTGIKGAVFGAGGTGGNGGGGGGGAGGAASNGQYGTWLYNGGIGGWGGIGGFGAAGCVLIYY